MSSFFKWKKKFKFYCSYFWIFFSYKLLSKTFGGWHYDQTFQHFYSVAGTKKKPLLNIVETIYEIAYFLLCNFLKTSGNTIFSILINAKLLIDRIKNILQMVQIKVILNEINSLTENYTAQLVNWTHSLCYKVNEESPPRTNW